MDISKLADHPAVIWMAPDQTEAFLSLFGGSCGTEIHNLSLTDRSGLPVKVKFDLVTGCIHEHREYIWVKHRKHWERVVHVVKAVEEPSAEPENKHGDIIRGSDGLLWQLVNDEWVLFKGTETD